MNKIAAVPPRCISPLEFKVTSTQKHREKTDVFGSLGHSYKCYDNSPSTLDQLFDEPTIRKMGQDQKLSDERKS